jgi:hypothetical protein
MSTGPNADIGAHSMRARQQVKRPRGGAAPADWDARNWRVKPQH